MNKGSKRLRPALLWLISLCWSVAALAGPGLTAIARTVQTAPLPQQTTEPVNGPGLVLDLNTASAAELKSLPGMGNAYVRRIIEGRPYTAKNQLVTRGVLPKEAYEAIRDRVVAHRPTRP